MNIYGKYYLVVQILKYLATVCTIIITILFTIYFD